MIRKSFAAGVVAAAVLGLWAAPVAAGAPTFQISPKSGLAGTTIHASDPESQCGNHTSGDEITVALSTSLPEAQVRAAASPILATVDVTTEQDGTWSADITVPDGTPPGTYYVLAHCRALSFDDEQYDYVPNTFTVTEPPTTTTSSTSTTTTTVKTEASTTTTTTTVAPVAAAATPVVASPKLTG